MTSVVENVLAANPERRPVAVQICDDDRQSVVVRVVFNEQNIDIDTGVRSGDDDLAPALTKALDLCAALTDAGVPVTEDFIDQSVLEEILEEAGVPVTEEEQPGISPAVAFSIALLIAIASYLIGL